MLLYPAAKWRPSSITHPKRDATWGIVVHWTVGHEAGDIQTLDGPAVDVQFYVAKDGDVYQFVDMDSQAWHAMHTANHNTIGIETEGSGEAWTPAQFRSMVKLSAFLADRYGIPARHVNPVTSHPDGTKPPPADWHGFMGHLDLRGIDGNNHSDTVPPGTGWGVFLSAVDDSMHPHELPAFSPPWQVFAGGKQIGAGRLINPALIQRISKALHAAGHNAPYTARVNGHVIAKGRFWPPGGFTKTISAHLRTGAVVVIDDTVLIEPKGVS